LLVKSDDDQILGDAAGFMVFGSSYQTCPACGRSIDRTSIIRGAYDEKPDVGGALAFFAVVAAAILWLIFG
jgi:hypothetical protein